jgi:S1-C subfamily serine protease
MFRMRHTALGTLLVGAGSLLAGIAFGRWLPTAPVTPVWTAAPIPAAPAASPTVAPTSFAEVVARVGPGVVTLRSIRRGGGEPMGSGAVGESTPADAEHGVRTGSGFVVNRLGLVVTSRHVVAGATAIAVLVPDRGEFVGSVVGEDPATDLALVRLAAPPPDLTALEIGASEHLRAGDWIVAVGNPLGLSQTVTAGVVSHVGRHLPHSDFAVTNDFLQFSAPVYPGSSGCPVVDLQGRVVGVTTQAAVAAQGISFAVPSRTLKWTLDAMARSQDGRVRRGHLGIEFASGNGVTDDGRRCGGAVIVRVAEGQPAHRAGVKAGDVVLRVDGDAVDDASVLHERIQRGAPGSRIALQVLRQGRLQDPIEAVLGEVGAPRSADPAN